jgi:hypothetical protein
MQGGKEVTAYRPHSRAPGRSPRALAGHPVTRDARLLLNVRLSGADGYDPDAGLGDEMAELARITISLAL